MHTQLPSFRFTALSVALLLSFGAQAGDAASSSSGLAADTLVNGQAISQNHVTLMSTSFSPDKNLPGPEARAAARVELITEEVLAQQARREGLDRRPAVADQIAFQQRAILSRAYLEDYFAKHPVTEDSVRSTYEWNRANGKISEYHVRQILLRNEADAREVIARLGKGEDFAKLASQLSQDPGGQNNGGDLGWFRPDLFVDPHFDEAVVALKKGDYSRQPLRTRFGWHVIKLEEGPRPVANPEPYEALNDSAKKALLQKTAQVQLETLTARLTAEARVSAPASAAGSP